MARPIFLELPTPDPQRQRDLRLQREMQNQAEAILAVHEVLQELRDRQFSPVGTWSYSIVRRAEGE